MNRVLIILFAITSPIIAERTGVIIRKAMVTPVATAGSPPSRPARVAAPPPSPRAILWKVTVTAYCPCEKCCGACSDGVTASGGPAKGLIVAAPPWVPFGTVILVPGYGRAVVEDRGGAIKGDRLDLLHSTHEAALQWGVQELVVTIERAE